MELEKIINEIVLISESYLQGKISGDDFDLKFDELLADQHSVLNKSSYFRLLEDSQEEFALYVSNEEHRRDYHGYFGDKELREKVEQFLIQLKAILLEK